MGIGGWCFSWVGKYRYHLPCIIIANMYQYVFVCVCICNAAPKSDSENIFFCNTYKLQYAKKKQQQQQVYEPVIQNCA